MSKIVKLSETDLTNIIKRVISESDNYYKPDQLYRRESMIARIKRGPKFIHKSILIFIYWGHRISIVITKLTR